jgi:hypothetical protein
MKREYTKTNHENSFIFHAQPSFQDIMSTAAGFSEQEEEEGDQYAWCVVVVLSWP